MNARLGSMLLVVVWAGGALGQPASRPARPPRGPRLPEGTNVMRDIEYAKVGDKSLQLDLYVPPHAKSARLPLVVWVHGGAWRAGTRANPPAARLLSSGFAVASVSYRLSQEAIFPAQIHDCKAAIRWLRAHAREHALDPNAVGVWGSSAGGHLVALLGTSGGVAEMDGKVGKHTDQPTRVQAVCDFFGPTNFLAMVGKPSNIPHGSAKSPESLLVGGPIGEHPDRVKAADPITYVTKDDPPFLIVHGDSDPLVPPDQSRLLHDALTKAGVETTLYLVKGGGHGGFRDPKVDELVLSFFTKHLKPEEKKRQETAREGD